jgi:uncharacterized protein DUF1264
MLSTRGKSRSLRSGRKAAGSAGIGAAAGAAAAIALLFGRKAVTTAKVGKGHPLKHRVLDAAAGAMQAKYPLSAMSTYLNGFHMYADEMGRQVEASHFCIHLRRMDRLGGRRCATRAERLDRGEWPLGVDLGYGSQRDLVPRLREGRVPPRPASYWHAAVPALPC